MVVSGDEIEELDGPRCARDDDPGVDDDGAGIADLGLKFRPGRDILASHDFN